MMLALCMACAGADSATELQVEARGVGKNAEAALKNALSNAVQQAVGAYLDQKTLVQNEAVIEDKILSVSAGFVQKYDELRPPRERSDGLWEAAIRAVVKKGEVGTALRTAGVMRVEADGRASWAQQASQLKNREDALALLEKLVPELLPNLVQGRIVSHSNEEDPKTGEQATNIQIEYRINLEWWDKEGYPAWDAAFSALQLASRPPLEMNVIVDPNQPTFELPSERELLSDPVGSFDLYRPGNASGSVWKRKRFHLPFDWMNKVNRVFLSPTGSGVTNKVYNVTMSSNTTIGNPPVAVFGKLLFLAGTGQILHETPVKFEWNLPDPWQGIRGYFPCFEARKFPHTGLYMQAAARLLIIPTEKGVRAGSIYPFFSADTHFRKLHFVGTKATIPLRTKLPEQVLSEMRSIELHPASFGVLSAQPGRKTTP